MLKRMVVLLLAAVFSLAVCAVALADPGGQSGSQVQSQTQAQKQEQEQEQQGQGQAKGHVLGEIKDKEIKAEIKAELKAQAANEGEDEQIRALKKVRVRFHGQEAKWELPPVIKEGRTLVPVRALSEGLGAAVRWDEAAKSITIVKGDVTIVLKLDTREYTLNGQPMSLDVPAQLISSRTFVPVRFVAEALKQKVNYDAATEEVSIESPDNAGKIVVQ